MDFEIARQMLAETKDCALEAGIYHAWFLSFGTCLGAVRHSKRVDPDIHDITFVRGIIQTDDDMDIGLLADKITPEQEQKYVELLRDRQMFRKRDEHAYRPDTGRHTWMSMRRHAPPRGARCCHWYWFKHKDFLWHSKAKRWVAPNKFSPQKVSYQMSDEGIALGIPAKLFERFAEVEFEGGKYNIPMLYGSVLDYWYPGWINPKSHCSSKQTFVLRIPKWKEPGRWVMMIK